jgi:hypothetical protein
LALIARLPDSAADVSPWHHRRLPAVAPNAAPGFEQGPVLVTVEYRVDAQSAKPFLRAMQRFGRVRRRDGASRRGVFRDLEHADVYLETFLMASWAEHLRQHERLTRGDGELEQGIRIHARGEPIVRHLIHVGSQGVAPEGGAHERTATARLVTRSRASRGRRMSVATARLRFLALCACTGAIRTCYHSSQRFASRVRPDERRKAGT